MRKVILMALLVVASSSAMAEWVTVGSGDSSTTYADSATISKTGNIVKMWWLDDFKKADTAANGKAYMSMKGQDEFDCKGEQSRQLYFSFHSELMGAGEMVYNETLNHPKWYPVSLGSAGAALWKIACGKK
ncbi:MAG: hypothetical protein PHD65_07020 [Gallionella sp.]|nr:hypothetical protein [Gallionella sp.]